MGSDEIRDKLSRQFGQDLLVLGNLGVQLLRAARDRTQGVLRRSYTVVTWPGRSPAQSSISAILGRS